MQAVSLPANLAPRLPAGSVRLGAVAAGTAMHLDVTLKVRDQSALTAFLDGLSNRKSPYFHDFLKPGQFGPLFGPSLSQLATVENALRAAGLSPGVVSSNRLSIPVTATALTIERAFRVDLVRYRLTNGRVAIANSTAPKLASSAASLVSGILGLNDMDVSQSMLSKPANPTAAAPGQAALKRTTATPSAAGPQACTDASQTATENGAYTASQLASYYLMSPLYSDGDLGQGVRVALAEIGPNLPSDISAYEQCYGIKTPVSYLKIDGGAGTGSGAPSPEAALDIEDVAGLAPGISVDVYQAPNSDADVYDMFKAIVDTDKDKVVSASFGECEALIEANDPAYFTDVTTLMSQAQTQGQTVFASAGDTGSSGCYGNGEATPDDNFPASSPFVVAVGGTTIESGGGETVWNESADEAGAAGGGDSTAWCMPAYQYQTAIPGLVNSLSETNAVCVKANKGGYVREIPDVSADADPESGYVIYAAGQWQSVGGTSAAAPLWAAIAALIDSSPFCADYGSGAAGVLPAGLYGMMALDHSYVYESVPEGLLDITEGNNDYTPTGYTGGLYPATEGFDMASGLGVPIVTGEDGSGHVSMFYPGLAALMCQYYATKLMSTSVTGISPNVGRAGRATTVTVHGHGFLPIAGADRAVVGATTLNATCSTASICKVTVPAESTRTINIQIIAEDLTPSAVTKADRFQYVAAPYVSSLSPNKGTHKGGTTVTIRGSNFIGVTSVHFGGKLGGKLRVISATEIKVVAPAGAGTVHVTVTAVGGTSNAPGFKYT